MLTMLRRSFCAFFCLALSVWLFPLSHTSSCFHLNHRYESERRVVVRTTVLIFFSVLLRGFHPFRCPPLPTPLRANVETVNSPFFLQWHSYYVV